MINPLPCMRRCLQFDTPAPIVEAGVEALRQGYTRYTPNTGTSALRKVGCSRGGSCACTPAALALPLLPQLLPCAPASCRNESGPAAHTLCDNA